MSDEDADARMDARLARAGAVWRAAAVLEQTGGTDDALPVGAPERVRARRRARVLLLASAAVVAAVLVVGGTIALRELRNPAPAAAGGPVTGTVWSLQGYGSEQGASSSAATFYLGSDGRLVADDTCEVVTAQARPAARHLEVSRLAVRSRACSDSVGEQTFTRGIAVLRSDPSYSVAGGGLTIGDGTDAMHLRAVPGALPPTSDVPTFQATTWRLVSGSAGGHTYRSGPAYPLLVVDRTQLRTGTGEANVVVDFRLHGERVEVGDSTSVPGGGSGPSPLSRLLARVYSARSFTERVAAATLTITAAGVGALTYRWVPHDQAGTRSGALMGHTWYLQSVAGEPAVSDTTRLRVSSGGALGGEDGCRPITGRAAVHAGSMTLGGVAQPSGAGACIDPAARDQASTIDSFLNGDVLWAVRDGRLWIDPAGGSQAFSLVLTGTPPGETSLGADDGYTGRWRVIAVRPAGRPGRTSLDPGLTLRLAVDGYRLTTLCGARSGAVSSPDPGRIDLDRPTTTSDHNCPYVRDADGPLGRLADRLLSGRVHWSLDGSGDLVLTRGGASVVLRGS